MNKLTKFLIGALIPVGLVLWYCISAVVAPSPFFPPAQDILNRFAELWLFARVQSDVVPSLLNLFAGYFIAVVAGIIIGTLLGRIWWIREMGLPLINFGRSVPPIMIIPPLVLLLGIGDASKIFVIAIGAVFPIIITTMDGFRQIDPALVDVSKSLQLSGTRTLQKVYLPAAMPSIFGGLQTGLQIALVLMVSSEMIAATRGIGYLTMQAQLTFNSPSVWAGIILLALLGFCINLLFTLVKNYALSWHNKMRATLESA